MDETMRAAVRVRYGPPDVVEIRDIPKPVPGAGEVLVRMEAASVNRADLDLIYPKPGVTRLFLGLRAPRQHRLGCDLAGVVEAVGAGVTRFRPGDRVFGDMYPFGLGSFAESMCAPERAFLPIPASMTTEVAATLPHAGILAIQGLRLRDGRTVQPGMKVLIDGASGNVGPFAVQIAKALGAEVTGVCSTGKMDLVRGLGADHVLDYTAIDYTTERERYDWIVDVDSHHPILEARRALVPKGVYVTLGGPAGRLLGSLVVGPVATLATGKRMGLMLWWKPFREDDVAALAGYVERGAVVATVDRRYPLEEAVDALRYVDGGHARGKVLITP